jgi:crotonobetainyl-CoA:carnitine CoA-transferase CaiB-like acyl-CoA transferase
MGVSATDRIYETADGYLSFAVAGRAVPRALEMLLGHDVSASEKYATPAARRENDLELTARLATVFGEHDLAWAQDTLSGVRAGLIRPVDVNHCMAFHRDGENQRSGRIASVVDPEVGTIREIAHLVRISDAHTAPHRLAPGHGEHTDEVLSDLGYAQADLDRLRSRRAIR